MILSAFRSSRPRPGDIRSTESLRHRRASTSSFSSSFLASRTRLPAVSNHFTEPSTTDEEPDLRDLNNALEALAEIFPDVRPDVFREMLSSFSDESRLHVVADQLLKYEARWVQGRWRVTSKVSSSKILSEVSDGESKELDEPQDPIPAEERFRSTTYKDAVRMALTEEFRGLSRTAIESVLLEQNYSYTNSRPILAGLSAKSWRMSFKTLVKWRRTAPEVHFMILPAKSSIPGVIPAPKLKNTSSEELNEELYNTIVRPHLDSQVQAQNMMGWELALKVNDEEAQAAEAIYECECCFDDSPFEQIAFCSTGEHKLCFKCIQNTISAALYSQAWSQSIDHARSAVSCFAPASDSCSGCIPNQLSKRAILQMRGGDKTWSKFEEKLTKDAVQASESKLQKCPFCTYAEADEVYWPAGSLEFKLKSTNSLSNLVLMLVALIWLTPLIWQYFWLSLILPLPRLWLMTTSALDLLARKQRLSPRFSCQNPSCLRSSCRLCRVAWRDPHKCNEREEISLRTTIEAARTAATKRVCPKCNTAFVKDSGCNKMTCTCG